MKKVFITIFSLVIFLAALSALLIKSGFFFPPLKVAVVDENKSQLLAKLLAEAGFSLPQRPIILGSDLVASVSGIKVTFSLDKDLKSQVRALQLVLSRLRIDGRMPKELDLRFNKAVIRY